MSDILKQLTYDQIQYLNSINNVISERADLYYDFAVSLSYLIDLTYMGDEVTNTIEDKKTHFNWCWNKNISNFKKENFAFAKSGEHYYYFLSHFMDVFYNSPQKSNKLFHNIIDFWSLINLNKIKSKTEYDIFIDIYKMFNKYFNQDT